ncbi:MAG: DUF4019 domain-containing protein [Candidatus Omnitrophica bacterium]|nr:DUF4019 domain-containing protein [Candidatus Omnitrophota bacterium]
MKRSIAVMLMVLFVSGVCFGASPEKKAKIAAKNWLESVDQKNYAKSYDDAAEFFKVMVKKDEWINTLTNLRSMLGPVESRELISEKYQEKMPGAPDGEYVIIVYKTDFRKKSDAREVVVPMLDKDGKWRVSGYHIQ